MKISFVDSPTGVYFVVYEGLQDLARKRSKSGQITPTSTILAGGTAGMVFWSLAVPFDVLKSRLQSGKNNLIFLKRICNQFILFYSTRGYLQTWYTKCFSGYYEHGGSKSIVPWRFAYPNTRLSLHRSCFYWCRVGQRFT